MTSPSLDPDPVGESQAEDTPAPTGDPPTMGAVVRHGMVLFLMAATPFLLLAGMFLLDGFIR
ncbi:MAG: hypothetical protein EA422_10990 [Gemmatimonadales bacterium]|nr:MAG: hypothetical protein EA422_10990 [Gemmatimonadales bacterium]